MMNLILHLLRYLFPQQPRTVTVNPDAGDFEDEPQYPPEPIPEIVRRQGAAQEQIDQHNEWRLHHELGRQSQWWADQLREHGEPVA